MYFDDKHGNTRWRDAERTDLSQLQEYDTFSDREKHTPTPPGFKKSKRT